MSATRLLLASVLALFLAATVFTVVQVGYLGFFELAVANWATRLMFLDLVITLGIILGWMYRDARVQDMAFVPYAAVTLCFGAAGPLLYLLRRPAGVGTA